MIVAVCLARTRRAQPKPNSRAAAQALSGPVRHNCGTPTLKLLCLWGLPGTPRIVSARVAGGAGEKPGQHQGE